MYLELGARLKASNSDNATSCMQLIFRATFGETSGERQR